MRPFVRTPLFFGLALYASFSYATLAGRVPTKLTTYITPSRFRRYANAYPAYSTEHDSQHIVDFNSNSFDVLFDNCANRTVSHEKHDFVNLRDYDGELQGIGTAQIKGIGTLHWQTLNDDGTLLNIYVEDALYVPKMNHHILSITQWGEQ